MTASPNNAMPPIVPAVAAVVAVYPERAQAHFGVLRGHIFDAAERLQAGPMTETLKWGEPAYLTPITGAGTTIRLTWKPRVPEMLQMLVHCQTSLVEHWRNRFPDLKYDGNRAVNLPLSEALPMHLLDPCIAMALTYHRTRS